MHKESRREARLKEEENVLILQGGGSLGAYECGLCKAFANHDMEFDIIGGTSIGAVNAAILAAGKYPEENEKQGESYYHKFQGSTSKRSINNNNAIDKQDPENNEDNNHHYTFRDKVKILEDFWLYIAEKDFGNWIFPTVSDLILPPYSSPEETRMVISSMRSLALGNSKVAIPR